MATFSSSCDHGYSTVKPDGTDDYREAMNSIMRKVIASPLTRPAVAVSSDYHMARLKKAYHAIRLDVHNNFPNCWNEILRRKVIAAGLNIVKSFCQHESFLSAPAQCQMEQLMLLSYVVVQIELKSASGLMFPDESPTCERDISLFFIKRAPCGCFDEQKRRLEGVTKTQPCNYEGCKKRDSYVNLQECSKCRMQAYCSADCQVKDWPTHKEDCKVWRKKKAAS